MSRVYQCPICKRQVETARKILLPKCRDCKEKMVDVTEKKKEEYKPRSPIYVPDDCRTQKFLINGKVVRGIKTDNSRRMEEFLIKMLETRQ